MKCWLTQNKNGLVRVWDSEPTYFYDDGWGRTNNDVYSDVKDIIGWPQFEEYAKEIKLQKGSMGIVPVELDIKITGEVPDTPF